MAFRQLLLLLLTKLLFSMLFFCHNYRADFVSYISGDEHKIDTTAVWCIAPIRIITAAYFIEFTMLQSHYICYVYVFVRVWNIFSPFNSSKLIIKSFIFMLLTKWNNPLNMSQNWFDLNISLNVWHTFF